MQCLIISLFVGDSVHAATLIYEKYFSNSGDQLLDFETVRDTSDGFILNNLLDVIKRNAPEPKVLVV